MSARPTAAARRKIVKRKRHSFAIVKDKPIIVQESLSSEDFNMLFVPDSDIPRRVKWDGYDRIRPWIATYVRDTYGCILSKCLIRYDIVKRGHWIKGPRREVSSGNN